MKTPGEGDEELTELWLFTFVCFTRNFFLCVFPTQGGAVSSAVIKSDVAEGDWHIRIERTKAMCVRSRNYDGKSWVYGGFEGNLDPS